jgi:hypothetical protein
MADETDRIGLGRRKDALVIETEVAVPPGLADPLRQRGLAGLARPVNQDDRRVHQGLDEAGPGKAGIERGAVMAANCVMLCVG